MNILLVIGDEQSIKIPYRHWLTNQVETAVHGKDHLNSVTEQGMVLRDRVISDRG